MVVSCTALAISTGDALTRATNVSNESLAWREYMPKGLCVIDPSWHENYHYCGLQFKFKHGYDEHVPLLDLECCMLSSFFVFNQHN